MVLLCINACKTCLSERIIGRRSDYSHEASGKKRHPAVQRVRVFGSGLQCKKAIKFPYSFLEALSFFGCSFPLCTLDHSKVFSEKGAEEAIEAENGCLAPIGITRISRIIGILR